MWSINIIFNLLLILYLVIRMVTVVIMWFLINIILKLILVTFYLVRFNVVIKESEGISHREQLYGLR